jgi:hypothetical protein
MGLDADRLLRGMSSTRRACGCISCARRRNSMPVISVMSPAANSASTGASGAARRSASNRCNAETGDCSQMRTHDGRGSGPTLSGAGACPTRRRRHHHHHHHHLPAARDHEGSICRGGERTFDGSRIEGAGPVRARGEIVRPLVTPAADLGAQHGGMDVELLVVPECPHAGAAAQLLRRALDDVGLAQVPIRTRVVSTWPDAERLGFVGSPTVRIDGEDPFSSAGRPVGLSCRMYRSEGARSGLPDLRELRRALKRHATGPPRRGSSRRL